MEVTSSLYECRVMHHRLSPLRNRFVYRIFMFYLNLDELDRLDQSLRLFSRNRFNLFSFRDTDHLRREGNRVKENVLAYLRQNGIDLSEGTVYLLTNVRTLGYVFNPVSFYFCFDAQGRPVCAVPEVGNTFGELKPYLLRTDDLQDGRFRRQMTKLFYVSPFADLDTTFAFDLRIPGDSLHIAIDDFDKGRKMFLSSLTGERKELSDRMLLFYFMTIPLVTVRIIALIHWQALKLYLRKLPFHRKADNPHLQQGVY